MKLCCTSVIVSLTAVCSLVAHADETDAFVGRAQLPDAGPAIDGILNRWIREAIDAANKRGKCDDNYLRKELSNRIHGFYINPKTRLPRAALEGWINDSKDIIKHHVEFKDSIYSDRPYDKLWLYPMTHHTIALADSIMLAGHYVGLDKINHFVREGLRYYQKAKSKSKKNPMPSEEFLKEYGATISKIGRRLESQLQGRGFTGVYSYGDLAANYAGYRFWSELMEFGNPDSYIECDTAANQYKLRENRPFTVANYVSDAWDEGINCSDYSNRMRESVTKVMTAKGLSCPVDGEACRRLRELPEAKLYVNPICLESSDTATSARPQGPTPTSTAAKALSAQ